MKSPSRPAMMVTLYVALVAGIAAWRVLLSVPDALDLGFVLSGLAAIGRGGLLAEIPWIGVPLLGNHFSPGILPLLPLGYWQWGGLGLVVAQAVSIGVAVWLLWREGARTGVPLHLVTLLTTAAAFHPALLYAAFFDFHANVFAAAFVALLIAGLLHDRTSWFVLGGVGAASMREDVALAVLLFALLNRSRIRSRGNLAVLVGATACLLAYAALSARSGLGRASLFGFVDVADPFGTVTSAVGNFLDGWHIVAVVLVLALPWALLGAVDWRIVMPFLLASLPVAFGSTPVGRSLAFHYYALIPIASAFAVISVKREMARTDVVRRRACWAMACVWLLAGPLGASWLAREYTRNSVPQLLVAQREDGGRSALLREAVRCVRSVSPVSVAGPALQWTAGRSGVYLVPQPFEPLEFVGGSGVLEILTPNLGAPIAVVAESDFDDAYRRDLANPYVYWRAGGRCISD